MSDSPETSHQDIESNNDKWPLNRGQRLRHRVELQSMQIEKVLNRHHIQTQVNGGSIQPGWIGFDLGSGLFGGWQKIRQLSKDLAAIFDIPHIKLEGQNGTFRLFVKNDAPHPVDLLELNEANPGIEGVGVSLGIDEDGRPILLDLSSADVNNILVTGVDGAGKSGLLRTFAISLSLGNKQSDVQIAVISCGNGSAGLVSRPNPLYPMNYLPHLLFPVVTAVDDAIESFEFLIDETKYRIENNLSSPLITLLVDDLDWLLRQGGQAILEPLAILLERSSNAGIRLIASATNFQSREMSLLLKYDFPMRFIGRAKDPDQAFFLTGEEITGAENLNGRGDFLAFFFGNSIRFQTAYIDDYDLHHTLSQLHRRGQLILLARKRNGAKDRPINFTYDSEMGQATIEGVAPESPSSTRKNIIENKKADSDSEDVTNEYSLLQRNDLIVEKADEMNGELAKTTANIGQISALPDFLAEKEIESSSPEKDFSEFDSEGGDQIEFEYSDIDEDEWSFTNRYSRDSVERETKRLH